MEFEKIELPAFSVIGMEGGTDDGPGFVKALWDRANARFSEIAALAVRDGNGMPRIWGLMSDKSRAFHPWENGFSEGLYLAGAEVYAEAEPPAGWTKWTAPARTYLTAPMRDTDSFREAIEALRARGEELAGAVYDRIDPATGETAMYFPVRPR